MNRRVLPSVGVCPTLRGVGASPTVPPDLPKGYVNRGTLQSCRASARSNSDSLLVPCTDPTVTKQRVQIESTLPSLFNR